MPDERAGPVEPSDVEALRDTLIESRRAFDQRMKELRTVDDKLLRSVRTGVIVVGLAVSAVGVTNPVEFSSLGRAPVTLSFGGISLLICSISVGVGAYTVSDVPYGLGDESRLDVQAGGYSEEAWLYELLTGYETWTQELKDQIHVNRALLSVTQNLLLGGIFSLVVAAGLVINQELSIGSLSVVAPALLAIAITAGLIVVWTKK